MNPQTVPFEEFSSLKPWKFTKVPGLPELNQQVAEEVTAALECAAREGRKLLVICGVGPLDLAYWAEAMNRAQTDGRLLEIMSMDEYLQADCRYVEESHPLSLGRFFREKLLDRLSGKARVPAGNFHRPDPTRPDQTTRFIEAHGGADLCYGGFGLTGHFAFNDPPPPEEPCDDEEIRNSRTRALTIGRESLTQICMGGADGDWETVPRRAVTLGLYELLLSKRIHLTFMRSWHSGVLRRALFGPVTGRCPGSFLQCHGDVRVTLTELAASLPCVHVEQRVGV